MRYEMKYLKRGDMRFPKNLESLPDCPDVIYVWGNVDILNDFSLAMVGSRNCSEFGKIFATEMAQKLNGKNIIIVSGLALGVDSAAHRGCVNNNGKTIAVLGGGFDNVYPKENMRLIDEIIENGGAVITEYMPEDPPLRKNFIDRNRIIAALSEGVILIEAKEKSGSLTTIRHAINLNKKIFVVPGGINDELYDGSNRILSEGAFCVRNVQDVLAKFDKYNQCDLSKEENSQKSKKMNEYEEEISPELREIYKKIKYKPTSLENICLDSKESTATILSKLTLLEMQGYIIELKGKNFIRRKL
ncbi:MAG: DNA-processing protein DprA [Clostridia bacterium]|nr:DNA-processing protein DprA [Clostridia bacterium]